MQVCVVCSPNLLKKQPRLEREREREREHDLFTYIHTYIHTYVYYVHIWEMYRYDPADGCCKGTPLLFSLIVCARTSFN